VIYHVGLVGLLNKARLTQIEISLSALTTPLIAGLEAGDVKRLRLVESSNHIYGDGDDVVLNTLKKNILVDGTAIVITDKGNATPVGLFPLPIGVLLRHYFIVAEIANNADSGNAFRVAAALGHITVSTPAQIGLQPHIDVTPLDLDLGAVALLVANLGAADLVIGSITTDDSRFTALPADLTVSPGNSSPITVTFTPDAGGALAANIDLVHNVPDTPTQVGLTGSGTVTSTPVQVTPMNVDFGNIEYGELGQTSIYLTNDGSGTITISSISSSDPQFSCNVISATLAPGESQPVALYFAAASLGTKTATLTVQQDGAQPLALSLRADATVVLDISNLSFGSIDPGQAAFLPLTIDNPSGAGDDHQYRLQQPEFCPRPHDLCDP